jgi:hypothetical protein
MRVRHLEDGPIGLAGRDFFGRHGATQNALSAPTKPKTRRTGEDEPHEAGLPADPRLLDNLSKMGACRIAGDAQGVSRLIEALSLGQKRREGRLPWRQIVKPGKKLRSRPNFSFRIIKAIAAALLVPKLGSCVRNGAISTSNGRASDGRDSATAPPR